MRVDAPLSTPLFASLATSSADPAAAANPAPADIVDPPQVADSTQAAGPPQAADPPQPAAPCGPPPAAFAAGVRAALPVALGYLPVGFAYGVLARGAGLTPTMTGAMSLMVYAGSAQFIGVNMIGTGAAAGAIVATTFLVNLRHLLFSAALSTRLHGEKPSRLALVSFGLTDETFSVASATYPECGGDSAYLLGLNLASYLTWFAAGVAGSILGGALGDPMRFGLDYALTAMFICLMVFNLKSVGTYVAAAAAGALGVLLLPGAGSWSVIIAAVAGATLGMGVEEWRTQR